MSRTLMLAAALRYADLGYPVFPCLPGAKEPMTEHGFKDATTNSDVITEWWTMWVAANVAIATAGLVVIDRDGANNRWLADQPEKQTDLGAAPTSVTPRGGRHHIFRAPTGETFRCSTAKLAPKVDVRADGGYILVPPSVVNEAPYRWGEGLQLDCPRDHLPEPPAWLLSELRRIARTPPAGARTARSPETADQTDIAEGTRNTTLASLAGAMRRRGMTRDEILGALKVVNQNRCRPPLDEAEVTAIASSIASYAPARPASQRKHEEAVAGETAEHEDASSSSPIILIGTDEHRVIAEAVAALRGDPDLYQRGPSLVRVLRDELRGDGVRRDAGSPTISVVPPPNLRERLTKYASFEKYNSKGDLVPAHPTSWLVNAVHSRAEWPGIRDLVAISDAPVLRPDGTVWQTPGYDAATGVLYAPTGSFPLIPDGVGLDDASEAVEQLLEVVCDFRFESEAHKAAWVAALLTPLARYAYAGPSPLFLIDANVRGAGKGLLTQCIARIVLGREMAVSSYAHDPDEMRKKITSIAIAGDRLVMLDNLEGKFGNDALDRALTSTRWRDRILGKSEQVELPLLSVWYATGNNVLVAADTTRRTIHIRLDVLEENPEDRRFKYPNLVAWIDQNRPRLLTAGLSIIAAFIRRGRSQGLRPMGSFEGWSALPREAVVWLGLPDPCETRDRLVQLADTAKNTLVQLIIAWRAIDPAGEGVVLSHLIARLYPRQREQTPDDSASTAMREAIDELVGCPPGKTPLPRQVGNRLKSYRRRVADGVYLDTTSSDRSGAVWRLYDAVTHKPVCESASLRI